MYLVESDVFGFAAWEVSILRQAGVCHGFIGRDLDISVNRREFEQRSGRRLLVLDQVHGTDVVDLTCHDLRSPACSHETLRADGWFGRLADLRNAEVAIGIRSADCAPVLMFDKDLNFVSLLHCGWRGTVEGGLLNGISLFKAHSVNVADIWVVVGPHATRWSYKIGPDVEPCFTQALDRCAGAVSSKLVSVIHRRNVANQGLASFGDIGALLTCQALEQGILQKRVMVSGLDTILSSELFYSFRREGKKSGRHLSFIA